jgi:Beta-galactosidase, domain 3/Beta-galactosidase, domain 2
MSSHRPLYSTSELFSHSTVGNREVALVYAYPGEYGETALGGFKATPTAKSYGGTITSSTTSSSIQLNYQHSGVNPIVISASGSPDLLLYVADYTQAVKFWAPETSVGTRVFVYGPYLVRNPTLSGSSLYLRGSTNATTPIEVAAPSSVTSLYWNGALVSTTTTSYGTLTGTLADPASMTLPNLATQQWKYSAGSHETSPAFDDSTWTNTSGTILGADSYGKVYLRSSTNHAHICLGYHYNSL